MFTGIITEVGTILHKIGGELDIRCNKIRDDAKLGDSIAVNGVDLTVRKINQNSLIFDVMPETFKRSNLDRAVAGSYVNLEPSVTTETSLSGHIVRGVVETTCALLSLTPDADALIARYQVSEEYLKYIAMKGPVCVDGASLTVMAKDETSFSVSLVQYTQEHTNLVNRIPGDLINLETDMMARYVAQFMQPMIQAAIETELDNRGVS
jgi:riboflavin synthase